jgi:hypothetical protein
MVVTPRRKVAESFALWPIACAICVVVFGALLAGIHPVDSILRPKAVKALFFLLGLVFPALAFVVAGDRVPQRVRAGIGIAGALLMLAYMLRTHQIGIIPFALIEIAVAWPLVRTMWHESEQRAWTAVTIALATFLGWSLAATLAYGWTIADLAGGRTPYASAPQIGIVFVVATLLGTVTFTWLSAAGSSRLVYIVDALTVMFFAIASWRRDLPYTGDNHHVSFFVGPVQAIQQGHWLLWDIPSQYGAANLWLIAHLPARNAYTAFTDANCVLIFAGALLIYATARTWARAPWAAAFCAATIIAGTFFVGGLWFARLGSEHYPSVGAMRFIWSYVLVALVAFCYARGYLASAPKRVLVAGTACWLAACWWSSESAIFATVMWAPTGFVLMWQAKMRTREMLAAVAMAAGALLLSVAVVTSTYVLHFGHGPDWLSFLEFGLLYQGGSEASPLTTFGGVWLLVSVFAVLVALALYCWTGRTLAGLPLLVAAATTEWATMSYYVVRSADNNVDNLIPIQLLVLFAAMAVIARERLPAIVGGPVRLFAVPIVAMTCALVWSAWPFFPHAGYFVRNPGNWGAVAPIISPLQQLLLEKHGLGPNSPVLYQGPSIFLMMPPQWPGMPVLPHLWTPGLPPLLIGQLPQARQTVYIERFAASEPAGGYILTDTSGVALNSSLEQAALLPVYAATVVDRSGPYVLTRYVRRR